MLIRKKHNATRPDEMTSEACPPDGANGKKFYKNLDWIAIGNVLTCLIVWIFIFAGFIGSSNLSEMSKMEQYLFHLGSVLFGFIYMPFIGLCVVWILFRSFKRRV